jgi:hypothetical protein
MSWVRFDNPRNKGEMTIDAREAAARKLFPSAASVNVVAEAGVVKVTLDDGKTAYITERALAAIATARAAGEEKK